MTVEEIYDKYQHFDVILSDKEWLQVDDNGEGKLINFILYDLWKCIKEAHMEHHDSNNLSSNI